MSMSEHKSIGDDLLWGVKAIASEINRSERQTRWLIDKGTLTVARASKGGQIFTTRSKLRSDFEAMLKGEVA